MLMKIGKPHWKCDQQGGLVEDMVETEGDHLDLQGAVPDHIHVLLHHGTTQGSQTGVDAMITLHQDLPPHHLRRTKNTGQNNDPLAQGGAAEARLGLDLSVVDIGLVFSPYKLDVALSAGRSGDRIRCSATKNVNAFSVSRL